MHYDCAAIPPNEHDMQCLRRDGQAIEMEGMGLQPIGLNVQPLQQGPTEPIRYEMQSNETWQVCLLANTMKNA